jgi:hypothetical protein
MSREIAAFAAALVVMRRPLDEVFGLLMTPSSRHDRVGAEVPRFAGAQPLQANVFPSVQEHNQIEMRDDRVAPAVERSTEHPVRAAQKHVAHQPQAIGDLALVTVGRRRRLPEIIVRVVMRDGECIGHGAAEAGDARARSSHDMNAPGFHLTQHSPGFINCDHQSHRLDRR